MTAHCYLKYSQSRRARTASSTTRSLRSSCLSSQGTGRDAVSSRPALSSSAATLCCTPGYVAMQNLYRAFTHQSFTPHNMGRSHAYGLQLSSTSSLAVCNSCSMLNLSLPGRQPLLYHAQRASEQIIEYALGGKMLTWPMRQHARWYPCQPQ